MRIKMAALVIAMVMWMTAPAWAGTINFTQATSGKQGTQLTYTAGGYSITATGYQEGYYGNSATDLYVKKSGGDESGLGINNENDHEIDTAQFIQLDLTSLADAGITSGDLTIGSVQSGEGYGIYTSNKPGKLGALELTGTLDDSPFLVSWSATDPIIGVTAYVPKYGNRDADILLVSLSTTNDPTPEPASLALMGTGLLGLALAYRRYSKFSLAKQ